MTRRNSRRINSKQEQNKQTEKPRQFSQDNPFGLSFVVATETVQLPSKGKYYDERSSLYGVSELELRHMTAKEEDLLVNENYIKKGTVLDKLLESLLIDKSIKVQDMIADDKYALLTSARITSYGQEYTFKTKCSSCGTEFNFDFDLQEMMDSDIIQELPEGVIETSDGTFEFQIDTKDLTVGIRILTLEEINYMSEQSDRRKELGISGSETLDFLNTVVDHVGGYSERQVLSKLFEVLPIKDVRKIRKIYNSVSPSLNQKQTRECPNCGEQNEREVPFSLGWFWPDVRVY